MAEEKTTEPRVPEELNKGIAVGYKTEDITGHSNIAFYKPSVSVRLDILENSLERIIEPLELRVAELIKERDEYDKRRRSAITLANKYKGLYDDLMEENNE